jgi:hypothetical protein
MGQPGKDAGKRAQGSAQQVRDPSERPRTPPGAPTSPGTGREGKRSNSPELGVGSNASTPCATTSRAIEAGELVHSDSFRPPGAGVGRALVEKLALLATGNSVLATGASRRARTEEGGALEDK